ncbi:MAG: NnrS family protein [Devosiaceae bacterium]
MPSIPHINTAEAGKTQPITPILTMGFRVFFLSAGLWACIAMGLWLGWLNGWVALSSAFDPVSWHAHAFLFGFVSAVVAGFLLTAVPNWTGEPAMVGMPLLALAIWWVIGRLATTFSFGLAAPLVAALDVSFLIILAGVVTRSLIRSGNTRNLIVVSALVVLAAGNALFHYQAFRGGAAYQGSGLRLGLSATLLLIMIVGGRIVPNFTRNWLKQQGVSPMLAPGMQRYDQVVLLVSAGVLLVWTFMPTSVVCGPLLLAMAGLHFVRLSRWQGHTTLAEPLVVVLHVAYAMVPLGALAIGLSILLVAPDIARGALHIWMVGAVVLMCLAVMTRATLGHSGQPLKAGAATVLIYAAILSAMALRVCAVLWPVMAPVLWTLSGLVWLLAFGLFVGFYAPLMLRKRT